MAILQTSKRRAAALLAGTFLMGAAGASIVDFPATSTAQAQNLSEQVPDTAVQRAPGFADIVDQVSPAVVSIQVKTRNARGQLSGLEGSPFENFFEEFEQRFGNRDGNNNRREFGNRNRGRQFSMGQGSGFIISADGYIVTNGHVVSGADEVDVVLQNGDTIQAEVIGVDEKTDLALVKVDNASDLPFVTFADQEVRVGDWVMAVGNPFGLGGSVTAGIVSARGREIGAGPYDDFIQIDAPINRGNSGGPTFNLDGEVVGINTAIYSPSGGSVGIGFAIPTSIAVSVIEDLRDDGRVTRGWLGVQIQQITPEIAESIGLDNVRGALVTEPQDGSPAEAAGLRTGDAIIAVNGEEVETPRDLALKISSIEPDSDVELTLFRDGSEEAVTVRLGTLDEQPQQEARSETPSARPEQAQTAALGMTLAPAADVGMDGPGLAVVEIDPEGPAASSGIEVGDVILQASGVELSSSRDLEAGIDQAQQDGRQNVLLKLQSGENTRFVALPVDEDRG